MRHGKKVNHLSRKSAHRKAMLANMASSLILHKRIKTTVAKAKALRTYVEPLLTKAKEDTTHQRRVVFSYLKQKEAVKELFDAVAKKIADRPGGYTRIIKIGNRFGDNAEMCIIELVDYNELYTQAKEQKSGGRKRRSRRGSSGSGSSAKKESTGSAVSEKASEVAGDVGEAANDASEEITSHVEEATEAVEEQVEETTEAVEETVEEVKDEVTEATEEVKEEVAEATEEPKAEDATEDSAEDEAEDSEDDKNKEA